MKLRHVEQREAYRFWLVFENGQSTEADLQNLIGQHVPVDAFPAAHIDEAWGYLEFLNGKVDIEPKTLYRYVFPVANPGLIPLIPHRKLAMQPIRQVIHDAPEFVAIPADLRHKPIELIIWPLDDGEPDAVLQPPRYRRAKVDQIIMPSREERNAR
ncbi:MAG: DUF2442 domain-containing protein [Candidatus Methylumidiphilus sp.]